MGLESVELLYEVEEKFGINIPDLEAEKIFAVGDFADAVYRKIKAAPNQKCLTQIVFYRIRQALVNLGGAREDISPDSKISDLLVSGNIQAEWERLQQEVQLKFPRLVRMDIDKSVEQDIKFFGIKIYKRTAPVTEHTIRKLIDWVISLNFDQLVDIEQISNKYEVERIVAGIISEKMGIPINEIELRYSITNDLGID